MNKKRFLWSVRPDALSENIVLLPKCRITVLTDRLLRLEYSQSGTFTDMASQSVFYRDFPACGYFVRDDGDYITVETAALRLTYRKDSEFTSETLSIALKEEPSGVWHYGDVVETLGGTAKTLDSVNDGIPLEEGLCSRSGFAVLDDSETMLLNEQGWVEPRREKGADLYFFGYGYDYRGCIKDFYRLTGVPPLLPAYALGNWWSRYYAYTQQEYMDLMSRFEEEDIPFSVAVIDMDWHIVDVPENLKPPHSAFEAQCDLRSGWTGYTWNTDLFPDYKGFLKFLHEHHHKVSLNLHPAGGVCAHEVQYTEMARAAGIDPASKERVRLDLLSPDFMANYFDILHHPYEKDGVDFWWMDWQQGTDYRWIHQANQDGALFDEREKTDPLWLLNHLHILDISRSGKRPMFFSRYSGPGSQRYPIGFSGDTCTTWDALKFQPYFTATASNIGYCWWSHDIGGHCGAYDEELITRWFQLGIFSPINRIHSGQSDFLHKEPWYFSEEFRTAAVESLRLRYRLFPYLYTMNYRCHNALEPLIQPMYYSHPKNNEAYNVPGQFWFGSELVVSAVSQPMNQENKLSETEVWLPQGDWFDFFTGLHYYAADNKSRRKIFRPIDRYPVFAKSGAIVPLMEQPPHEHRCMSADKMDILVFPGQDHTFTLYEDAGDGFAYENGGFCRTELRLDWSSSAAVFTIEPAQGDLSLIPQRRSWNIMLRGFHKTASVKAFVNGAELAVTPVYSAESNTVSVAVTACATESVRLEITAENLVHDNADWISRCEEILMRTKIYTTEKQKIFDIIKMNNVSAHDKMAKLFYEVPLVYSTILALREMMTLTKGEYENEKKEKS